MKELRSCDLTYKIFLMVAFFQVMLYLFLVLPVLPAIGIYLDGLKVPVQKFAFYSLMLDETDISTTVL